MTTPVENPYIQDLSTSYGPMLAGAALSCALWGISCMQLFMYAGNHGKDPLALQLLVYGVWLLDTASEALTMAGFWGPLITRWGSLEELGLIRVTNIHRLWIVCLVGFIVQSYYFYRIYRLGGKRWLIGIVILMPLVVYQLVMPVMFVKWCLEDLSFATLLTQRVKIIEMILRASNALVDVAIMVSMIYLLANYQHSEFRKTRKMLDRLVIMTVNTGLWTALLALLDLILVIVYPNGIQYCVIEFPLGALYVNAFLANLNARSYIRGEGTGITSVELESGRTTGLTFRNGRSHVSKGSHSQMAVHVTTDTAVLNETSSFDKVRARDF
ncbi:hypothetical protein C8Q76DRAFT_177027 [Earliella scabrosa]|nr:hypothetical protein C8Q76DRAFT_177027 [Earliella scabrosa]